MYEFGIQNQTAQNQIVQNQVEQNQTAQNQTAQDQAVMNQTVQEEGNAAELTSSIFLPQVKFEAIPINQLVSNQEYQRNKSERHIRLASENFSLHQLNPVKVSRRDGINYVVNGQHTMEIVATVSGSRETPVWCMVYDDLVYKQEAEIFANQQKYVKSLTPFEIFIANIEAGNDKQLLIRELVESYGLQLAPVSKPCCICAVSTLEYLYDRYGYELLSRTLRILIGAWEGNQQSLSASILKGLAKVLTVFGTEIKDDNLIDKLSMVSIKEIIRCARERKGGTTGCAEAILMVYNKKMHNPLSMEKLHERTHAKAQMRYQEPLKEVLQESPVLQGSSQQITYPAMDYYERKETMYQ